jgi:hypothetical protein
MYSAPHGYDARAWLGSIFAASRFISWQFFLVEFGSSQERSDRFRSVTDTLVAVQPLQVSPYRRHRDGEDLGDLFIGSSGRSEPDNLGLPGREAKWTRGGLPWIHTRLLRV